jgi:carbon catabolite-derepressing protein kinase
LDASGSSLHHAESVKSSGRGPKPVFKQLDPKSKYKLPKDPWVIHVRWKTDGLYPPGVVPPGSQPSSAIDLRRQSVSSLSSASGSVAESQVSSPSKSSKPSRTCYIFMHMDIQLYEMERGVYLVDFKCAGYENADGLMLEDKEVTSPFPFLDLASKLIIQLAESD